MTKGKHASGCCLCGEATLGWHYNCGLPVCPDCRIAHAKRCPAKNDTKRKRK